MGEGKRDRVITTGKHPETGFLLTIEGDISEAWRLHYVRLAANVTGNNRRRERLDTWRQHPQRGHLIKLDRVI